MSLAPMTGVTAVGPAAAPAPIAPISPIAAAVPQAVAAAVLSGSEAALSQMVSDAAITQAGLAPLLANLPAASEAPALPDDVRVALAQILAAQTPLSGDATAADLRAATRNSGVFLEAALAAALSGTGEDAAQATSSDLKAQLLRLTAALQRLAPDPGQVRADAPRPPPPTAGGQLAGQQAAPGTIDAEASAAATARVLARQANAALARVQLSQAASLPQAGGAARWSFEAPVATPAGPGVAQFEISRDAPRAAKDDAQAPVWRARFSVDAAPGGPVHAELAMSGGRVRVGLTAADPATRQALEAGQAELAGELAAEGDDVALRFATGAPSIAPPPAGRLVDRRS